uniref:Uncharacterized protein n=1 Tax=uncultured Thiotrichaceae bacterium TaxID=298394 RepID=A0A6S6TYI3_9GAMM|nr:MAG: Unknown protein [uncultured Thiotrichaceae bacterium]
MGFVLTLIGLVVLAAGGMMVYRPKALPDMARLYLDEIAFQAYASVGRILLGIALVVYADHSRLPVILTILGTLSLLSGIAFMFMEPEKFRMFVKDMLAKVDDFGIYPGMVVALVGLVVLYAVW